MLNDAARWYANSTFLVNLTASDPVAAKNGTTISVVLPARDEQGDGRGRCWRHSSRSGRRFLVWTRSWSWTWTRAIARLGSLRTPEHGSSPARTSSLSSECARGRARRWEVSVRHLRRAAGLRGRRPRRRRVPLRHRSPRPFLTEPHVALVKAFYDRPLVTEEGVSLYGGGRVTELVARPLVNLPLPDLAGIVQPLSGEYAGRRAALERLPFACGYGVEIGMLIDLVGAYGVDVIAQVDLGHRVHRHQADTALGVMAAEILATALRRLPTPCRCSWMRV